MAQVISGQRFGNGFTLLFGNYDPNNPPPNADAALGNVDWMYIRLGSGSANTWIYRCSASAVIGSGGVLQTPATWVAK